MRATDGARRSWFALSLAAGIALSACGMAGSNEIIASTDVGATPIFHADENPERLSEWNIVDVRRGELALTKAVVPYDLNTSLFTDYAHKLRTVYLPEGSSARYDERETFDFPVGTIISKTFYYPIAGGGPGRVRRSTDATAARLLQGFDLSKVRLVETRLLVHRSEGWIALPYVWNDQQTDAVLKRTGAMQQLTMVDPSGKERSFTYVVPNANQCQGCHATNATTKVIHPIGPKARHLNKGFAYPDGQENQLARWKRLGLISGLPTGAADLPRNALWGDATFSLDDRARSYLDINCSHCHNRNGPADTSGLDLERDTPVGERLGRCKLPIAAGTGTGDRKFGIVPGHPEESILSFRMGSTNPSVMMPELGRSLRHEEGVALISEWIAKMPGKCS